MLYTHLRAILPILMIAGLTLISRTTISAPSDPVEQIGRFLQKAEKNGYAGSVMVVAGGEILLSKGYGKADRESGRAQTPKTVFSVGSITKQFTGAAILKLEEQGKLSVQDPITRYFKDVPADKRSISLHHLLTHSAGFPGAIGDDYDTISAAEFVEQAMQSELLFPPGQGYEYSNVGFSLLGIIIEQVSGRGYEAFLRENLFLPAGMEHTGYQLPGFRKEQLAVGYRNGRRWGTAIDRPWAADGPGWHLRANGGILSSTEDMYRWYLALKNQVVLSEASLGKLFYPHNREGEGADSFYGYGWVVQELDGNKVVWHNGGNGVYNAFMGFVPDQDIAIIVSSNSNDKISDDLAMRIQQILAGTLESLEEDRAVRWSGQYQLPYGASFSVRFDEFDRLIATFDSPEVYQLLNADGSEQPEQTGVAELRTRTILEGIFRSDFAPLAHALGEPEEAVRRMASDYWQRQQEERGPFLSITLMGTVSRRQGRFLLTLARIDFEQRPLYQLFIWDGDQLYDRRESEDVRKELDFQGDGRFLAPSNGLSARFEETAEGSVVLVLEGSVGAIRAVRK